MVAYYRGVRYSERSMSCRVRQENGSSFHKTLQQYAFRAVKLKPRTWSAGHYVSSMAQIHVIITTETQTKYKYTAICIQRVVDVFQRPMLCGGTSCVRLYPRWYNPPSHSDEL